MTFSPSEPGGSRGSGSEAGVSRRSVLQSAGGAIAAVAAGGCAAPSDPNPPRQTDAPAPAAASRVVTLRVNGHSHEMTIEPRVTLLDALREVNGMTGTKKGCDRGQCGACTVLADGRRINACLTLAVMQEGVAITTIEGLGTPQTLHPMQAAFIKHDAFQCGYCTPGQICSAVALINEHRAGQASAVTADLRRSTPALDDAEIRERMSGNLCRCGAYPNIVAAVRSVAGGPATAMAEAAVDAPNLFNRERSDAQR